MKCFGPIDRGVSVLRALGTSACAHVDPTGARKEEKRSGVFLAISYLKKTPNPFFFFDPFFFPL
jgi:hypothetical protein